MVRVVWRRRRGLFSIALEHGFRVIGTVLIIRFLLRREHRRGGRHLFRDRRSGRQLLLYRTGIGIRNGPAWGMQIRDVCSRIGIGSSITCGL